MKKMIRRLLLTALTLPVLLLSACTEAKPAAPPSDLPAAAFREETPSIPPSEPAESAAAPVSSADETAGYDFRMRLLKRTASPSNILSLSIWLMRTGRARLNKLISDTA
jgi:hypothetical protein